MPTDPNPSISPSTGERRTEMAMTQNDLTARIDERLAYPVRPPVYVEIVDPSGRVSYRRWSDHPDVLEALWTRGYAVRRCPQQPELEGEAHPDRALLVEARAQIAAQAEALAMLQVMREGHERTIKRAQQRGETGDATVAAFYGNVVSTHEGFCAQLDLIAAALGAQS